MMIDGTPTWRALQGPSFRPPDSLADASAKLERYVQNWDVSNGLIDGGIRRAVIGKLGMPVEPDRTNELPPIPEIDDSFRKIKVPDEASLIVQPDWAYAYDVAFFDVPNPQNWRVERFMVGRKARDAVIAWEFFYIPKEVAARVPVSRKFRL